VWKIISHKKWMWDSGGDLATTTCTILKRRRLAHIATSVTLLFLQYYYKYITQLTKTIR